MAAPPGTEPFTAAPTRGDLVWAKIYGFPWWPSQVRSVRGLRPRDDSNVPKLRVRFLHTLDNAEIDMEKVLPYTEKNSLIGVVKPKMFKSKNLEKKFVAAVAEAASWQPAAEPEEWSDDEVVEDEEVAASREEASAHRHEWKDAGHELLGQHVARFFGASRGPKVQAYLAVVSKWAEWEDAKLFHVIHDDGDEEDLDEEEARKGVAAYRRQPEPRRRKHEQHAAKEERRRKVEERAKQPKRWRSAFVLFSLSHRPAVVEAAPHASAADVSRRLTEAWREADATTRAEHEAAAAADWQRYLGECADAGVDPQGERLGRGGGPLPPLTALGFFKERSEVALGVRVSAEEAEVCFGVPLSASGGFCVLVASDGFWWLLRASGGF